MVSSSVELAEMRDAGIVIHGRASGGRNVHRGSAGEAAAPLLLSLLHFGYFPSSG